MTQVLLVAAFELSHPMPLIILPEPDDMLLHGN